MYEIGSEISEFAIVVHWTPRYISFVKEIFLFPLSPADFYRFCDHFATRKKNFFYVACWWIEDGRCWKEIYFWGALSEGSSDRGKLPSSSSIKIQWTFFLFVCLFVNLQLCKRDSRDSTCSLNAFCSFLLRRFFSSFLQKNQEVELVYYSLSFSLNLFANI